MRRLCTIAMLEYSAETATELPRAAYEFTMIPMQPKTAQISGVGQPTVHAKQAVADSMYSKGLAFLGAAVLTSQLAKKKENAHGRPDEATEYVLLHLLCQGLEIVIKGLLLMHDFAKYRPILKRKFGHNLEKLVAEGVATGIVDAPSPEVVEELTELNKFFMEHRLRYGDFTDLFFNPLLIEHAYVERWSMGWLNRAAARVDVWRKTGAL